MASGVRSTRPGTLTAVAVVAVAVGWTGVSVWSSMSGLPRVSRGAPFALMFLAAVLTGGALLMRRRVRARGPGAPMVSPDLAVRLLVLAQASSLVGSLVAGLYGGAAVFYASDLDVPLRRTSAGWSAASAVAALAVVLTAVWLERECRVPPDDDTPKGQPSRA